MSHVNIEDLNKILKRLEKRSEIIGSAIVEQNGLLITARLPRDIDDRKFGALAATMFGSLETAVSFLENDKVDNLTVELKDYKIIVFNVGKYIFVSLIDLNVNLGLILIEIEETLKIIEETLKKK